MDWFADSNFWVALGVCAAAALSTVLGSLFVIFSKEPSPRLLAFGLAFAGGAMVYVSLIEIFWKAEQGFAQVHDPKTAYVYATLSFFAGALLLILLDRSIPNPHGAISSANGDQAHIKRVGLLAAFAITAHNFP
jgi:zinc transporter, ZIP family